ncbi:hypothetical protein BASA81_008653 [Batrachochytrium salamandrivorans]|nr:hypothetical protein BASA81_008653 [Batrachochytrium salamandrivorans]
MAPCPPPPPRQAALRLARLARRRKKTRVGDTNEPPPSQNTEQSSTAEPKGHSPHEQTPFGEKVIAALPSAQTSERIPGPREEEEEEPTSLSGRLVKLLHDKLGAPEDTIGIALTKLQKDGSWIKETRHVKNVLEAKTPKLAVGDLAGVFDFEHVVKSAHDLLVQVFSDPTHNKAVLFGHKGQGKTQTLHFIMRLLQELGELVALLDERSITSGTQLMMQSSENYWFKPFQRISEAKIEKMRTTAKELQASADNASARSKELASPDETIANANSVDVEESRGKALGAFPIDIEYGYDIAEKAFRIAESAGVAPDAENLFEVAMETAKKVKSMEESFKKLADGNIVAFNQANTEVSEAAVIADWARAFANRILSTAPFEGSQLVFFGERAIRNFHKLVAQLYMLAAELYKTGPNADVMPAICSEEADVAADAVEIAQRLPKPGYDGAEDVKKLAAYAYQVGEKAMNKEAMGTATISFKMAAKFYRTLANVDRRWAVPNEMTADAYQLASNWYEWAAATKMQAAAKLSAKLFLFAWGLSQNPLLQDLSTIATDGGCRVWILVDNLPEWGNHGVLYHELFQQGEPHFVVTGGVGMGKWTFDRGLEESVVDLPFLAKDAGWGLVTKLERELGVSGHLQQQLVDYGEPADHIESKCGGIPGYIVDLVLKSKQDGCIDDCLSRLQMDLNGLLEKKSPVPKTFAETCLKAFRTLDPWRFLRRADLCGRLPPRGAILEMIREWLVLFGELKPEDMEQLEEILHKGSKIDDEPQKKLGGMDDRYISYEEFARKYPGIGREHYTAIRDEKKSLVRLNGKDLVLCSGQTEIRRKIGSNKWFEVWDSSCMLRESRAVACKSFASDTSPMLDVRCELKQGELDRGTLRVIYC